MIAACLLSIATSVLTSAWPGARIQDSPPVAVQATQNNSAVKAPNLRQNALALDVTQLPRAKEGHWVEWEPSEQPKEEIAAAYLAATKAYAQDDVLMAVHHCQELLHKTPDYPPALLVLGASCYRLQRYGDAIVCYERFLKHAPSGLSRTRQLGHCYHALGHTQKSVAHYSRLIELQPKDGRLFRSRAVSYLRDGDPSKARPDIHSALQYGANDADTLYWWAAILYELGDKRALMAARKARRADPFASRCTFLVAQNLFDNAGAKPSKEDKESRINFEQLQAAEKSIRIWQQELYLNPAELQPAENIARAHLGLGDLARAKRAYQRLQTAALKYAQPDWHAKATRAIAGIEKAGTGR